MISLFNVPTHNIDTSIFTNLLHDKIVGGFEENFCELVGAPYGCSINSASSALFLLTKYFINSYSIDLPTMIPCVVPNAILNAGKKVNFLDNINWVGNSYTFFENNTLKIIDSAQEVIINDKFESSNKIIIKVYSFYPTKPISSCDGGMIVSNDRNIIEYLRKLIYNGVSFQDSWKMKPDTIGWKMHMNSIQAYIANLNLITYTTKLEKLNQVKLWYKELIGVENRSNHLFRVKTKHNITTMTELLKNEITTGIHYNCCHSNALYNNGIYLFLQNSIIQENTMLSVPFHEKLKKENVEYVCKSIEKYM